MCLRLRLALALGVVLLAVTLHAPVDAQESSSSSSSRRGSRNGFSGLSSILGDSASQGITRFVSRIKSGATKIAENIVKFAVVRSTKDEICYRVLGCFRLNSPWISLRRPLPAPKNPNDIRVQFYLYTRQDPQRFSIVDSPKLTMDGSSFEPDKGTFFLVHGFLNSGNETWMADLKDALLSQVDGNVFIVDWGGGALDPNYLQAASNTRVVGRELALLGRALMERYGADPQDFHFLGHSLGSHISGYAARNISNVGRVTAFDPAGPGFEALPRLVRLNKYCADFVDVLHTNAKPVLQLGFGMMHPIGHVDFYLNGGVEQPGCALPNIPQPKSLMDLVAMPFTTVKELVSCAHIRSYEYFTEAVNNTDCRFWGHRVSVARQRLKWRMNLPSEVPEKTGECSGARCVPIGLDTPLFPGRGTFSVVTGSASPFCLAEESDKGQTLEELEDLGYIR